LKQNDYALELKPIDMKEYMHPVTKEFDYQDGSGGPKMGLKLIAKNDNGLYYCTPSYFNSHMNVKYNDCIPGRVKNAQRVLKNFSLESKYLHLREIERRSFYGSPSESINIDNFEWFEIVLKYNNEEYSV